MSRRKVRVGVSLGCNCGRLLRLGSKPIKHKKPSSTTNTMDMDTRSALVGGFGVAVEKDSEDPYLDFRQSMVQMIVDKQIYSKDGLRDLLNCFLHLNSPYYHGIILRAFTQIWNGLYSSSSV